jgi:hypothetical protein
LLDRVVNGRREGGWPGKFERGASAAVSFQDSVQLLAITKPVQNAYVSAEGGWWSKDSLCDALVAALCVSKHDQRNDTIIVQRSQYCDGDGVDNGSQDKS